MQNMVFCHSFTAKLYEDFKRDTQWHGFSVLLKSRVVSQRPKRRASPLVLCMHIDAPEPPPILEASKSTRKPRPTKLQKLMAQHGVDDPEALPAYLRAKQHSFKHKSSQPIGMRPHPLQLGLDRSDSGTPTSQQFHVSGPQSIHHGPILTSVPLGHVQPAFTFDPPHLQHA
jgi:hypothetical protein